jgi:hypothetical protein
LATRYTNRSTAVSASMSLLIWRNFFASFRGPLVFQSERPLAPIAAYGHDGIVVLFIAGVGKLIAGTNFCVGSPPHQLLRALQCQVNFIEVDGVVDSFRKLPINWTAWKAGVIFAQACQFGGTSRADSDIAFGSERNSSFYLLRCVLRWDCAGFAVTHPRATR